MPMPKLTQHELKARFASLKWASLRLPESEIVTRFNAHGLEMLEPYKGIFVKVLARCIKCNYEYKTTPSNISNGKGCPSCANRLRLTQAEVATRYRAAGFELLGLYKNNRMKILARCVKCHYEWQTRPTNVFRGDGCPKCAGNARLTEAEAAAKFANQGLEMLGPYRRSTERILSRCVKCGYKWKVNAASIFVGGGCPCCADYGFQPKKAAILYYVKISNPFGEPLYKIGVTNQLSVQRRFRKEFSKMEVIETWHFPSGVEAYEMEQDVLSDYDADRYEGPAVLDCTGNDELFNFDVLGLDNGRGQLELVA